VAVFLWNQKVSYLAVPKVACTSIKLMLFAYENQRPWQPLRVNGQDMHIHLLYPTLTWDELPVRRMFDHDRFALVRDPVERLLSCYSNRVVYHRELSIAKAAAALEKYDLTPDPSLDLFVDRLEDYSAASPLIHHHSRPMVDFLGRDPGYFAGLFPLARIDAFLARLSLRLGQPLEAAQEQRSGIRLEPAMLSSARLVKLKRHYDEDYSVFGGWL